MMCLGLKPGVVRWKMQTIPRSYGARQLKLLLCLPYLKCDQIWRNSATLAKVKNLWKTCVGLFSVL